MLNVDGELRDVGEDVPEAESWGNLLAYLHSGQVIALDDEAYKEHVKQREEIKLQRLKDEHQAELAAKRLAAAEARRKAQEATEEADKNAKAALELDKEYQAKQSASKPSNQPSNQPTSQQPTKGAS